MEPLGDQLVNVEPAADLESHLDTAGGAGEGAQVAEIALDGALLLAAEFAVGQLLQGVVDFFSAELPVSEDDDPRVGMLVIPFPTLEGRAEGIP